MAHSRLLACRRGQGGARELTTQDWATLAKMEDLEAVIDGDPILLDATLEGFDITKKRLAGEERYRLRKRYERNKVLEA